MTQGLKRYQQSGDFHFVTFSCYRRKPYLYNSASRNLFEAALESTRKKYEFKVLGYVVLPEHVHLLLTEPMEALLAEALMSLKISSGKRLKESPFWQTRYYDFNVFTSSKQTEKLKYIRRNPVRRGLVERPEDWPWSSFRHYLTGERGTVEIESAWSAGLRDHAWLRSQAGKTIKNYRYTVSHLKHDETVLKVGHPHSRTSPRGITPVS